MSNDGALRADFYYVGNFDDQILQCNDAQLNLDIINSTLSQAVIAGCPLLVNDGYLMLYEAGRKALTDSKSSPLLHLLDTGFVQIFSRTDGNLADLPENMDHIPSFQRLLKEESWKKTKWYLRERQKGWKDKGSIVNWPSKDAGSGFASLISVAFQNLTSSLPNGIEENIAADLHAEFQQAARNSTTLAARSIWNQLLDSKPLTPRSKNFWRWVGIETYHYDMAMLASLAKPGRTPGVVTRYSELFRDVQRIWKSRAEGVPLSEIPKPRIPAGIAQKELLKGAFLKQFVDPTSDLYARKSEYLFAIENALKDKNACAEAFSKATAYGDEIRRALNKDAAPRTTLFTDALSVVVGMGGAYLGHKISAPMPSWGLGMVTTAATKTVDALVLKPFIRERRYDFRSQVNLAIDIVKPVSPELTGKKLSEPRLPGRWFAFLPLSMEDSRTHALALPDR